MAAPATPSSGTAASDAGWGRHRRTDAIAEVDAPRDTAKADAALSGFGRDARRAIRQLAALDKALGTRESGSPLALAVVNAGLSVYCTADALGFPDARTAAAQLPDGVVPLSSMVGVAHAGEFAAKWTGANDAASVLALAARDGVINPKAIYALDRDPEIPLPAGVEVVSRATVAGVTPADCSVPLVDSLLPAAEGTDLISRITELAGIWELPLDEDLSAEEASEYVVKHRWDDRQARPVLVATIWWLLLAAVEALVAGDTAYAR
jgi:hypothetical protein